MEKQQGRWKRQLRWMKEGAKNFRLSLSLRVSLNYLRFFLINGVIFNDDSIVIRKTNTPII